jgi:outer membrane beta-barrel protein
MSALERELLLGEGGDSSSSPEITDNPVAAEEASPEVVPAPTVDKDDLETLEQAVAGPDRIPYDQVLVVQKRFILKEDRSEITPIFIGIQPADSFRRQFEWGFSYARHFTESFGLEFAHVAFLTNYNNGLDESIYKKTGRMVDFNVAPVVMLGASAIWTPFKSKAATRSNVYHFETYFNLGGGMALSETSKDPMGMFGAGFRAFLNRRSLMKFELRDYVQFGSSTNHRLSFMVGGGFLL